MFMWFEDKCLEFPTRFLLWNSTFINEHSGVTSGIKIPIKSMTFHFLSDLPRLKLDPLYFLNFTFATIIIIVVIFQIVISILYSPFWSWNK